MTELEELFVDIPGYPNYLVSNYGRVINKVHGYDLKFSHGTQGHCKVKLYHDGISRDKQVHQLVAQAFFLEWEEGLEVKHIIADFNDNSVTNLTLGNFVWSK